ncbi:hypothetical protein AALB47_24770 [Lachnospiraceae bacterium 54-11]
MGKGTVRYQAAIAGRSLHIPAHTGGEEIRKPWWGKHKIDIVRCAFLLWRVGTIDLRKKDFRYGF